ncbi:hypothetical protein CPAV1605_1224 [seawater metagenome]|uniref:Calcineurin-like phosphoesterase domain-containing protein n=1 Tax=seawater metagenome TaxID=1561972 RepID=A0A5E8CJ92_9ZZZZ
MNQEGVWMNYPNKIFAVGDLHGDFYVLEHVLLDLAKVASKESDTFQWIGGDNIIVFCGDLIDRYRKRPGIHYTVDDENSDKKIIIELINLKKQAKSKGGDVVLLLGNHELLNFEGAFNYVSNFGKYDERKNDFKRGSDFVKLIAENFLLAAKIENWVFVHGGFCPSAFKDNAYLTSGNCIPKLNKVIKGYLIDPNFFNNPNITQSDKDQMQILIDALYGINENKSPLNCRHYGTNKKIDNCEVELDTKVFRFLFEDPSKGKMVIAHTPQFISNMNINSTCEGKIWRLDVGMSRGFDEHYKMIEKMLVKTGMNLIKQLRTVISQDNYRYMAILEISKTNQKIITEKRFSRDKYRNNNLENSEAIFTIHQLDSLKKKLENGNLKLIPDIEYQQKDIIDNINQLINYLQQKHPKELIGGGNDNIYLIHY